MPDFKLEAARAAITFIKNGSSIGLGAGTTIKYLVGFLKEDQSLAASLSFFSSSFTTKLLLQQNGFTVGEIQATGKIDIYFDGCDQFDSNLHALKSGGGIHTMEKLLAAMAEEFILLGDESKFVKKMDARYPLVLEIIPDALSFVIYRLRNLAGVASVNLRLGDKKDGAVITERGNYLIDLFFEEFPEPASVEPLLSGIPGILEHSLFYNMAHKAVIAGEKGTRVISRP